MLERASEATPLPGCDLEARDRLALRQHRVNHIERRDDLRQPLRLTRADMRARMRDEIWNAKHIAPPNLLDKQLDALPPKVLVHGREIDEVAVVADGALQLEPLELLLPLRDGFSLKRRRLPLLLVLGEALKRLAAELLRGEQRILDTASNRKMCTKHSAADCTGRRGHFQPRATCTRDAGSRLLRLP